MTSGPNYENSSVPNLEAFDCKYSSYVSLLIPTGNKIISGNSVIRIQEYKIVQDQIIC